MDPTLEIAARLLFAVAVFAIMAAWEVLAPRRSACGRPGGRAGRAISASSWSMRWSVRLLVPAAAVGASLYAAGHGIGLFHYLNLRLSVAALLGFLILDLVIYAQHVVFHHVPWLWRLHRMHHADLDIDVTTGFRFHPFEILISLGIKIAVVAGVRHPAGRGVHLRGRAQRHLAVQPLQRGDAAVARPHRAARAGDARHAPRASFDRARGDRQQFRIQPAVVGSSVRDLPARAAGRPRGHDHRHAGVPRPQGASPRPDADAAVPAATAAMGPADVRVSAWRLGSLAGRTVFQGSELVVAGACAFSRFIVAL